MKKYFYLFAVFLTSCGSGESKRDPTPTPSASSTPTEIPIPGPDISSKVESLVDEFIANCKSAGNTACISRSTYLIRPISLVSAESVQVFCPSAKGPDGCATTGYDMGSIPFKLKVLIRDSIASAPEKSYELRALLWHELGHALLGRSHTPQTESSVLSIMFPYYPSGFSKYSNGNSPKRCSDETRFDLTTTGNNPIYCTQTALVDSECSKAREEYLLDDTKWKKIPPQCTKYVPKLITYMSSIFGLSLIDFFEE
jgi:hypothetical protein